MSDGVDVWVVHEPLGRHGTRILDLRDAHRYGRVQPLLAAGSREVMNDPAGAIAVIRQKLINFKPTDYLLLAGSPAAIGAATAIASERTGGVVRVLCWDKERCCYDPLELGGLAA